MSMTAMLWAMDAAKSGPMARGVRMTLVALADYAGPDGRGAYPSVASIAARLGMKERQIRYDLAWLEAHEVIRPGDQRLVAHFPKSHRPFVRDLALAVVDLPDWGGVQSSAPPESEAPEPVDNPEWGALYDSHGVQSIAPKPNTQPNTPTHLGLEGDTPAREAAPMASRDPGPPVRLIGDTSPGCPVCGQPIHRTHRCRVSALDPSPPPRRDPVPPVAEQIPGQAELPLLDHDPCAVCGTTLAHRPLVDDGMCARCYVAHARHAEIEAAMRRHPAGKGLDP